MKINRIYSIYFSATLTTEKVALTLASEISEHTKAEIKSYNFAYPKNRERFPKLKSTDLVIFAMPTYAGRLPNLMLPYLDTIDGKGALAIPIVTFGNRAYDDSLSELVDLLEDHSFHTVAAGAFSCEHSFSTELGKGRPDEEDIRDIKAFGKAVCGYISGLKLVPERVNVRSEALEESKNAKGYFQPKQGSKPIDIRNVKPKTSDKCTSCGLCAEICPMGSIDASDFKSIMGKCIKCGACIKCCPSHAKYIDDEGYLYHKRNLEELYGGRRADNVVFMDL